MRTIAIAVALGAMISLAACGGSQVVREPPAPLKDFKAERQVKRLWSSDIGASAVKMPTVLSPALEGNMIYATDPYGKVSAYDAMSGRERWQTGLSQRIAGATAAGSGIVVVTTQKGEVIALDGNDGRRRWSSALTSQALAPAAIGDGVVVVQTVDGTLTAFSVSDGARLWRSERTEPPLSLHGTARPQIVTNVVLTGFASGKVAALELRSGKLLWEFPVTQPRGRNEIERLVDVDVAPVVVGSVVYAASYQGKLIALDAQSGRILWSRDVSTFSGMDADAANIYLTDEHGLVLAFDLRTGASVWKQDQLRGRQLSAPRVLDGVVGVGDFDGYVHWLSSEDGHLVARYRIGSSPIRSQALTERDIYFVNDQSGDLAALRLEKN